MARFFFILALLPTAVFAAPGGAFSIASESLPSAPTTSESGPLLLRLKQQAVREYLQRVLGPRYDKYDALITPEFSERYILEYQVVRQSPDSSQMEIAGSLDIGALREWVRVNETKATGSTILKPLFLISSNVPELTMDPRHSHGLIRQNALAQTLYRDLNQVFQKFNATLGTSEDISLSVGRPPAQERELRALKSYGAQGGYNSAVWAHLSVCRNCGIRIDFHLYNLSQARQILAVSVDAEMDTSELKDPKKLTRVVGKALADFGEGFEASVSKGTLFASEYRLVVQPVETYKTFKLIDSVLAKQDFLLQQSFSRGKRGVAEFRVLSPLPPKELYQRFQIVQGPGLVLRPAATDGQTITLQSATQ